MPAVCRNILKISARAEGPLTQTVKSPFPWRSEGASGPHPGTSKHHPYAFGQLRLCRHPNGRHGRMIRKIAGTRLGWVPLEHTSGGVASATWPQMTAFAPASSPSWCASQTRPLPRTDTGERIHVQATNKRSLGTANHGSGSGVHPIPRRSPQWRIVAYCSHWQTDRRGEDSSMGSPSRSRKPPPGSHSGRGLSVPPPCARRPQSTKRTCWPRSN